MIKKFTDAMKILPYNHCFLSVFLCVFVSSCFTTLEEEVTLHSSPEGDTEYYQVYTKVTSNYEIIKNFETHYTLYSTFLNRAFLKALSSRYQRIFNEPQPILEEVSDKFGFFVSVYSANREKKDLTDNTIWNIQLKTDDKVKKPILIKHLPRKERWKPFFKGISPWSREYLILFKKSSAHLSSDKLLRKTRNVLVISSSEAKVEIEF